MSVRRRRVELLDTCILLNLLEIPFESDDCASVGEELEAKREHGTTLRLPAASLIEAGDHVGRIKDGVRRRRCAKRLERLIQRTCEGQTPWSFSKLSWDQAFVRELLQPALGGPQPGTMTNSLASRYLEMGDLCVLAEFRRLREALDSSVVDVDVWTLDSKLRAAVDALRAQG